PWVCRNYERAFTEGNRVLPAPQFPSRRAIAYGNIQAGENSRCEYFHRQKGGGFRLRLKAGSVRLRRTQITLKPSSGSGGLWFLMYSAQTSSVTLPLLATQYPRAHRCWPQYLFRKLANSASSLWELRPLRYCTARDTERLGGTDSSMWTWSRLIDPA